MLDGIIDLTQNQKVLFYSAMISIIVQLVCVYCLIESKDSFKINNCVCYIIFSSIAYLFYYKIVLP
jgi:hypothetical protein